MDKQTFLKKIEIELKISKASPHTVQNYLKQNQLLLDFTKKQPNEITIEDIKHYISENLINSAAATITLFLAAIKYAHTNILKTDPTLTIKRPKKEIHLPTTLSKQEIKLLLSKIKNEKSNLIVSLIYACGFRVSELSNLKIQDLNLPEKNRQVVT